MKMSPVVIAIRASKTFIQSLTAILGLDAVTALVNIPTKGALLAASVSAGLSALTNALTDLEGRYTNG